MSGHGREKEESEEEREPSLYDDDAQDISGHEYSTAPSYPHIRRNLHQSFTHIAPIPRQCFGNGVPCIMGIDEAGRGPVLGAMVYAVCFHPENCKEQLKEIGFADSKILNEKQREKLFDDINDEENAEWLGWAVHVLSPAELSRGNPFDCRFINIDT